MITYNRKISLAYLVVLVVLCVSQTVSGINIPFFGSFRAHQQPEQSKHLIFNYFAWKNILHANYTVKRLK